MSIENLGLIPKLVGALAGALLSILFIEPKTMKDGARRFIGSLIAGPLISALVLHQTQWPVTFEFIALSSCIAAFLAYPVLKTGYRVAQAYIERKADS